MNFLQLLLSLIYTIAKNLTLNFSVERSIIEYTILVNYTKNSLIKCCEANEPKPHVFFTCKY